MPISAKCSCGKEYDFRDEFAGKQVKCDACGKVIEVPKGEAAPDGGNKVVLVVTLCATGLVVLVSAVLLIWYFSTRGAEAPTKVAAQLVPAPPKPAPAPIFAPLPAVAPMPVLAAPVRAAPDPKDRGPEANLPPMAAVEILMPFSGYATWWCILPDNAVMQDYKAAHVSDVGGWVRWVTAHPKAVPAIMFPRKQITKEKLFSLLGGRTPEMEKETIPAESSPTKKDMPITWYKYQDVAFAIDSLDMVVAIRINTAPAAALPPAEPQ